MANDSQDARFGQPADRFLRTDDSDTEQDTEGHYVRYRGDDNPIGQPADAIVHRSDTPDSDDDVEGHSAKLRGDGTVEEKDIRAL